MLFNSFSFLVFFPVVTALYFLLPHRVRWLLLLAASCLFYMYFVPIYILILAFTIIIDYVAGIAIEREGTHGGGKPGGRKLAYLWLSIAANVGILAFFKYFNFLNDNIAALAHWLGWNYSIGALRILLPIGLSFHTFQAMSYTIEVYRGNQKAERHFGIYALYVMFYPQLVAGPIERPQNLLHQFHERHYFNEADAVAGLRLMLWGMFQKVVIADRASMAVNEVFRSPESFHGLSILLALILFSFQIYCDFAGYSNIAIGTARFMGFRLMTNFNRPYLAQSIADFWRRWHISLSTWFKDYVYVPMGGNRVSLPRQVLNLMAVFALSGLWHGANWTYVIWGALHGACISASLLIKRIRPAPRSMEKSPKKPWPYRLWSRLVVFAIVTVAWAFFRAKDASQAVFMLRRCAEGVVNAARNMLHGHALPQEFVQYITSMRVALGMIALLLVVETIQERLGPTFEFHRLPVIARWAIYEILLLMVLFMGSNGGSQFIYFQF